MILGKSNSCFGRSKIKIENCLKKSLVEMRNGESGKLVYIDGGKGLYTKLEEMGIRLGSIITKVSGQLFGGPIIIKVGTIQVGIGHGMASKIILEVPPEELPSQHNKHFIT